jgi:hypothetical protein
VSRQDLDVIIAIRLLRILPYLNRAITTTRNKPPRRTRLVAARAGDLARGHGGRPTHAVDAAAAGLEDLVRPVVVLELEHGDVAVGGGAGE